VIVALPRVIRVEVGCVDEQILFKFVAALLLVLALIGGIAFLVRRAGLTPRLSGRRGGERRLSLVEVAPLDARRRLVLVRRDGVEHLLLLGTERDLVIESGITVAPRAFPIGMTADRQSGAPEHEPA
jgi:flagellar protein FliO/FliZ